jgi:hypothetical protein
MKTLLLAFLLATPCMAQADALKLSMPKPAAKVRTFDTGWWARAHWTAAAFDYSTTGLANRECLDRFGMFPNTTCREQDPLARPFIGRHPQPWRLSLGFVAESAAVSFIPNKKVRRIVQVGLIASHLICGAKNLKTWH